MALLELRLAERDAHAAASLEELRAAELRGEGREARLSLLQREIVTCASEVLMRDERLGLIHARLAITTEQLDAKVRPRSHEIAYEIACRRKAPRCSACVHPNATC